jgi:hypothetical protein
MYPQNNIKVANFSMYQEQPPNYYQKNTTQFNANQIKQNTTTNEV